jgi:hypothetical protein
MSVFAGRSGSVFDRKGNNMKTGCAERGVNIARGIRGCSSFFFIPVFSLSLGIVISQYYGIWLGVISGFIMLIVSMWCAGKLIDRSQARLTVIDCFLPMVISLLSGVVFFPLSLVSGNLFSPATCIVSGVLLTLGLFGYREGKIDSAGWLVFPFLTFVYEILPVDLPTDIDNLLGLGTTTVIEVAGLLKSRRSAEVITCESSNSCNNDDNVIEV